MGAPLNPVPQVLRVFLEGFIDSINVQKWGNVLHFSYTGTPPTNAVCATIAQDIYTQWLTHMAPECPSPTELDSVTVTDLTSDTAGSGEFSTTGGSGTRGDDSIPANAAFLISYPSSLRYKGGHPRTYLYVLGNADMDGAGMWSGAATTEVTTHWQAFLTACLLTVSGCTMTDFVSIRYRGKFLPNSGAPHFYLDTPLVNVIPISEAVGVQKMASQRRRIGRRKS